MIVYRFFTKEKKNVVAAMHVIQFVLMRQSICLRMRKVLSIP